VEKVRYLAMSGAKRSSLIIVHIKKNHRFIAFFAQFDTNFKCFACSTPNITTRHFKNTDLYFRITLGQATDEMTD
jgi:hypothetical protein